MATKSPTATLGSPEQATPHRLESALGILRSMARTVALGLVLALALVDYVRAACLSRHIALRHRRARWLQRWSCIVARLIGLQLEHRGTPPRSGMIVSNHLSYLDILAYSALVPCVFVAKQEVSHWPIFGLFARLSGTIFVDRTRRLKVAAANHRISEALHAGLVVVLFPEGTSSDGRIVLPFHSSLLEPAIVSARPLTLAAIHYLPERGAVADEICYWGEMTLVPHLLNLLSLPKIRTRITFTPVEDTMSLNSRKAAAYEWHRIINCLFAILLREGLSGSPIEESLP
jgi:1-acyl-sn-glycerol-3-phosphate acyltransferase